MQQFRRARKSDHNYVVTTWLKSYQPSSALPPAVYWSAFGHRGLVWHLVRTGDVFILGDEGDSIDGWVCRSTDGLTIHYVYVREESRRFGIGGQLFAVADGALAAFVSHNTRDAKHLMRGDNRPEIISPYEFVSREEKKNGTADKDS